MMKQTNLLPNTKYRSGSNNVSLDVYYFDSKQRRDTAFKNLRGRTPFSSYSKRKSYPLEVKNGMFTTPNFDAGKVIVYVSETGTIGICPTVTTPTLSFLIITRDSEQHIAEVLQQSKQFRPDEVVVCINNKSKDRTEAIAKQFTNKAYLLDFDKPYLESVLDEAYSKCTKDWIFRLDDDELISANFMSVRNKISSSDITAYFMPRYSCIKDVKHYISSSPWYPDWQLRLFKRSNLQTHDKVVHHVTPVSGKHERWNDCHIFHLNYLWRSRDERERRWEEYSAGKHIDLLKPMSLHEDYELRWKNDIKECTEQPISNVSVVSVPAATHTKRTIDTATIMPNEKINELDFKLVQMQTTSVCNARCEVCGYKDSWMLSNKGYMSDKSYKKIIDNIAYLDPHFHGKFCPYLMNEMFADPKIVSRMRYAWQTLHNPFMEISSNVSLLTKDKIKELVELYEEFGWHGTFIISHFGIDKESYKRTMKIPYEKGLSNMIAVIEAFDDRIPMRINNLGVSRDKKMAFFGNEEIERYTNNIIEENSLPTKNLRTHKLSFHNRSGNVKMDGWSYKRIIRQIDEQHPFDCLRIHNCLHVLNNGEVCIGCMDYNHEEIFGDLSKQTIEEVFASEKWFDLRDRVLGEASSKSDFLCKKCLSPGG